MGLMDKLDRKLGRFAIKGLMTYIVALNLAVYLLMFIDKEGALINKLIFHPQLILAGEVWRLVTFVFIPPDTSLLWILFTLYFYHLVGSGLEGEMGSFRFNVYYLLGVFSTVIAGFIAMGGATVFFLNISLFLAFAYIYPNYQIMIFFILPVKVKYIAWFDALYLGFVFVTGNLNVKLIVAAALLNFFVFFGKDMVVGIRNNGVSFYRKKSYTVKTTKKGAFHKCTVCGMTELDDKNMDFRYCSGCQGDYEYCMNHLKNHEHIQ